MKFDDEFDEFDKYMIILLANQSNLLNYKEIPSKIFMVDIHFSVFFCVVFFNK